MKYPRKITLWRIASHDFNRSLRIWKTRLSDTEILRSLINERARAQAISLRSFGLSLIGALWLSTAHATLALKLPLIDLTIPLAYVNFAVAIFVFGTAVNATNYLMLNEFVRIASNKLFGFNAPWVLTVLHDGGNTWSIPLVRQYRFFQSSKAHNRLGMAVLWLTNLPFLAVLIAVYWIEIQVGIYVLSHDGILSAGGAFTVIAWLLIMYPVAFITVMQIPFEFTKNVLFIRWIFLRNIYRRSGGVWVPRTFASADENVARKRAEIESQNEARTAELRRKHGLG
jgi:hypothetical protein